LPAVRESLERATATFQASLAESPAAEYVQGRGLGPAIGAHRLGYVDQEIPGYERFVGRLAIPNICASGVVVGIKFRDITGLDKVKYDQPAGQAARLFNLNALNTAGESIALTEGELDTVALSTLGIPSVGIPGASSWKRHHWRLFEGFQKVFFFGDQDDAGRALLKALMATSLPILPCIPPGGANDVNEALIAGRGPQLLRLFTGEK